jgi:L-alanine-DL-glutamate epimerase-like enolase superfamily enzyme
MNRRSFLKTCAASAAAGRLVASAQHINKITLANTEGRFHKFVTMNAYDKAPKGHTYVNTVVRVHVNSAMEGAGVMGYPLPDAALVSALKTLIGADPMQLYQMEGGRITGRNPQYAEVLKKYRFLDGPLFDLIGKMTGKAAWQLMGDAARDTVEAYDGTLYFSDIWFSDLGVRAVVQEAEEAQRSGYRAIKLKLGRGYRWMDKDAGLKRDIEVVQAVRKAVGPAMRIMADPNNGYQHDRERAWRLMSETADAKLYWIEEIFPETVEDYTWLKDKMSQAGIHTLIADGENFDQPAEFDPYLKPRRLMDVLQTDIRRCGFLDEMEVARKAEPAGANLIPHNWGSQTGVLMALQMAKAVKNISFVEDDRSTCEIFTVEGYEFHDGVYKVPDAPGLSYRVDESRYTLRCKPGEILIS